MKKLSFKIIGIIALFSLGLFIFISGDDIFSRKKDIMPLFSQRANATVNSLIASIRTEEELRDKDRLMSLIQKNMWLDPDITKIKINIFEGDKMILYVSNDPENVGQISDADSADSFTKNVVTNQITTEGKTEIMEVTSPISISGKVVGTVEIYFDLTDINATINETMGEEILGYFIMLNIFILALFLIFRLIVIKPILAVNKGIIAIRNHNLHYKIKVTSQDEIGKLAQAFNDMADDLKNSKMELENYNEKLKQQVNEQTKGLESAKNNLETINLNLETKVKTRTLELEKLKLEQEELVKTRTLELNQKVDELEKLNKFMINRENKMIELKKEIDELKKDNKV